jgi:ribose 5-phosphate isomerase B
MSANKHQEIRSALCWKAEIAQLARLHNNANICTMPARYISLQESIEIINVFLNTSFEGGRHERRVNKIKCI